MILDDNHLARSLTAQSVGLCSLVFWSTASQSTKKAVAFSYLLTPSIASLSFGLYPKAAKNGFVGCAPPVNDPSPEINTSGGVDTIIVIFITLHFYLDTVIDTIDTTLSP